jgi:hypothetical protein
MRRPVAVTTALLLGAAAALACGDKLMLIMGARSGLIKPVHPAMILAYPGRLASATVIRSLELQPALKKAGHKIQVIEDPAALDSALKGGKYDVVVADIANAAELSLQLPAAPGRPVLLPVAFKAPKEEMTAAQKRYHCLLKAPGDVENYLSAIDQAMDWKLKAASR